MGTSVKNTFLKKAMAVGLTFFLSSCAITDKENSVNNNNKSSDKGLSEPFNPPFVAIDEKPEDDESPNMGLE